MAHTRFSVVETPVSPADSETISINIKPIARLIDQEAAAAAAAVELGKAARQTPENVVTLSKAERALAALRTVQNVLNTPGVYVRDRCPFAAQGEESFRYDE